MEWLPEDDGRYVSTALGIAFRAEGAYLRTYDHSKRLLPTREERRLENQRLADENASLRAELERLRRDENVH